MDDKIELLRNKLEKLIEVTENLVDSEVVFLNCELDKLILNYYFSVASRQHLCDQQQNVTDEIMKYKKLLDEKIITKEEFSIKEKELLR
ncbi:aspartyl-phosphate phosphatase Spo0E family protein [Clostridium sp.]|uniref:aspartyl-phosphate phosphatase Spo0E family protein n=1 Tax=Clostridium sp. TaxID=1506 RepID=UPI0026078E86|nr:aspartyl-phosphate phosphatase Spo0E family protein [uncultured Clostridium sp.]